MTDISNDKIKKTKGHASIAIPELFLFSAYMENEEFKDTGYSPVQNQLLYVGKKGETATDPVTQPILKTDTKGQLYHFDGDLENNGSGITLRAPYRSGNITGFSPAKQLDTIIPPSDMVLREAIKHGADWLKKFSTSMQEMQDTIETNATADIKKNGSDIPTLKPAKIKKSQLRRPTDQPSDTTYREWYTTLTKDSVIHGYRLPRTRAIFFVFNLNILDLKGGSEIIVHIPGNDPTVIPSKEIQDFTKKGTQVLYIVPLTGTDKTLPAGRYKIDVISPKDSTNTQYWNSRIAGNSTLKKTGNETYSLSFNVKFDIQNTAGEFSIINADPISLEEALIKQYPHYYNHLLHASLTDSHADLKSENASSSNTPTKKDSHPLTPAINAWNTTKQISDIANKTIKVQSTPQLLNLVIQTLHNKFSPQENQQLRQSLDLVFQTQATIDAWNGLREKAVGFLEKLNGGNATDTMKTVDVLKKIMFQHSSGERSAAANALREAARDTPWFGPPELDADYDKSLGKFLGISQEAVHFLGKAMDIADIVTGGISIVDSIYSFDMARTKLHTNKGVLDDLTRQYLEFLGKLPVTKEVNIEVNFESGKYDIRPEDEKYLKDEILPYLNKDDQNEITIEGYTDSVGSEDDNDLLSLNRAKAIKKWLLQNSKLKESLLKTRGYGEKQLKEPDPLKESDPQFTDGYSNISNRRCVAKINLQVHNDGAPCRQAINTLEKSRYITVTQHMQVGEEFVKVMESAVDFALSVLPYIVPVTALACTAISLAKEGVKLAQTVDQATGGNLDKLVSGDEMKTNLLFESLSNQTLLRDLYNEHAKDGKISETKLSSLQLRLRSEAIGGMLRLIVRAWASAENEEEFEKQIDKYQLNAYIQNFILNDGWSMPLHPPVALSMDEFWLFAVNEYNKDKTKTNPLEHFGIDKTYKLIDYSSVSKYSMLSSHAQIADAATVTTHNLSKAIINSIGKKGGIPLYGMHMMSITGEVPNHVNSAFHEDYPIHHFAAGLDNYKDFAKEINPNFKGLNNDIYEHTAIYFQETKVIDLDPEIKLETKWKSIAQNELDYYNNNKNKVSNPVITNDTVDQDLDDDFGGWTYGLNSLKTNNRILRAAYGKNKRLYSQKSISPITPVKVLIVFKNTHEKDKKLVDRITPVSIKLIRYDNILNIDGPVYKSLARKLTIEDLEGLDDLKPEQKQKITGTKADGSKDPDNKGMYGCIIHPFFQFGNITHAGLKPASTGNSMKDIFDESNRGGFRDMKYGFICKVGNEDDTRIKVPFSTKKYWNGSDEIDSFDDEITVTLDKFSPIQKKLLHKGFLKNNTKKLDYPLFFKNSNPQQRHLDVTAFIRIGGGKDDKEDNPFLPPLPLQSEIEHYNKLHPQGAKITLNGGLCIDNFDWKTQVDFVFTLACTEPQIEFYKKDIKTNHRSIGCSTSFVNSGGFFSNVEGSSITGMRLAPIGLVSIIPMIKQISDSDAKNLTDSYAKGLNNYYISTAKRLAAERLADKRIDFLKPDPPLTEAEKLSCLKENDRSPIDVIYVYVFTKLPQPKATPEVSAFVKAINTENEAYKLYSFDKTTKSGITQGGVKIGTVEILTPYKHLKEMVHNETSDDFYIFAAGKPMGYQHPLTGENINSIRPFGDTDDFRRGVYYEYNLNKFITSGKSSGGKPIKFKHKPVFRFSADKVMDALKPGNDEYLNKNPNWKNEIKDWIENKPTKDKGPDKL